MDLLFVNCSLWGWKFADEKWFSMWLELRAAVVTLRANLREIPIVKTPVWQLKYYPYHWSILNFESLNFCVVVIVFEFPIWFLFYCKREQLCICLFFIICIFLLILISWGDAACTCIFVIAMSKTWLNKDKTEKGKRGLPEC